MLLGTYVCTETPGEFKWVNGVLTQALIEGSWLVLEHIDAVPADIIAIINSLMEISALHIPHRNEFFRPAETFRLFATSESASVLSKLPKWITVDFSSFSQQDLIEMMPPSLGNPNLISMLTAIYSKCTEIKGRSLYTKDWLKLCNRLTYHIEKLYGFGGISNNHISEKLKEMIFLEASEVFKGTRDTAAMISAISTVLNLPEPHLQALWNARNPIISTQKFEFQLGKAPPLPVAELAQIDFAATPYTLRLLERLCTGVAMDEALLCVGETGCGKTTAVQYLARILKVKLHVHNLSQMSDSSDLIGGYKPVTGLVMIKSILNQFLEIYPVVVDKEAKQKIIAKIRNAYGEEDIQSMLKYMKKAIDKIQSHDIPHQTQDSLNNLYESILNATKITKNSKFAFKFLEGSLVTALRKGHWLLLDEINLAGEEVLERLHSILEGKGLILTEKAETEEIKKHPNFRIFGCMNPGMQAGKKELPMALRRKFTELYVEDMEQREDIECVVNWYLTGVANRYVIQSVVDFYMHMRASSKNGTLENGQGKPPQFTLRTLSKALKYAKSFAKVYTIQASLVNGLRVHFITQLAEAHRIYAEKYLIKLNLISSKIAPKIALDEVDLYGFAYSKGPFPVFNDPNFILTPTVSKQLIDISRALIQENSSILLEGPTSAGKTTMVKHLAELSGHKFVRINNHQHTDIEEYLGSYVSDESGKLVYREGVLVEAVRCGYFLVLDELNLAPSEVLEALNRLLDDNRELLIPETQTIVKPHPHFRLFATQNPAATYAGRKELSYAFRNRFVEMFVPELPDDELVVILEKRGRLAPSYAKTLVSIFRELQRQRQASSAFLGKQGFITIRDLLKIAAREPIGYDQLALYTYLIIAERLRNDTERQFVKSIIAKNCKNILVNEDQFYEQYCIDNKLYELMSEITEDQLKEQGLRRITWNAHMKRLFVLVDIALKHKEPVLLVGETGCSKTTICQILSLLNRRQLKTVNCHQHSETSDFIGGLRPIRGIEKLRSEVNEMLLEFSEGLSEEIQQILRDDNQSLEEKWAVYSKLENIPDEITNKFQRAMKLFEWQDGPLIEAFKLGEFLLLDEVSLADDSVLERLNSVLESDRRLFVPEKGGEFTDELCPDDGFQMLATMNPGGDYGKKELSPALRNRFTEIWVKLGYPEIREILIQRHKEAVCDIMLNFMIWYNEHAKVPMSLRDVLAWGDFINIGDLEETRAIWEGLCLIVLEGQDELTRNQSLSFIHQFLQIPTYNLQILDTPTSFGIDPFIQPKNILSESVNYSFKGPAITQNLYKLLRGLHTQKAIMLEGPPGIGKTSIVESLAKVLGYKVTRINMSEETDLIDLLGCDLPRGNRFEWSDGVLLSALKQGHWVILDELNLCSQPVLEGLNALLDHRSSVFIPEINQTIYPAAGFRIFAAQNPVVQGGGRKGLPKSFLNRFSRIQILPLLSEDYLSVITELHPTVPDSDKLVRFNEIVRSYLGDTWDFNLRDMLRFCEGGSIEMLYYYRMRTQDQRDSILSAYSQAFNNSMNIPKVPYFNITPSHLHLGSQYLPISPQSTSLQLIPTQLGVLEQLLICIQRNWPVILVGNTGEGKSSLCRLASLLHNQTLHEYSLSPTTDASDLLGSYEQTQHGTFEWFKSTLVTAIEEGQWVLLRDPNSAPAAVLDRINSLLEPGGFLLINERGLVNGSPYIVYPHPNFRLFLTYDSKYGEVSRALRNRCVELYVSCEVSYLDICSMGGCEMLSKELYEKVERFGLNPVVKYIELCRKNVIYRDNFVLCYESLMTKELAEYVFDTYYNQVVTHSHRASFEQLLQDPISSILNQEANFLSFHSQSPESILCFMMRGCISDLSQRSSYLSLPSYSSTFSGILNTLFSDISDTTRYLDDYQDLYRDIYISAYYIFNLIRYSSISVELDRLSNPVFYSMLYWRSICSSEIMRNKIDKKLIEIGYNITSQNQTLSKDVRKLWKFRFNLSKLIRNSEFDFNANKLVHSSAFKKAVEGCNASSNLSNPYKIIVRLPDLSEVEVILMLDKKTFESSKAYCFEEISEIMEETLKRKLSEVLDSSQISTNITNFQNNIEKFEVIPSSIVKSLFLLRKSSSLEQSLHEIAPICLNTSRNIVTSYFSILENVRTCDILSAPKLWYQLDILLNLPEIHNSLTIPMRYIDTLSRELHNFKETSKFVAQENNKALEMIEYGLILYDIFTHIAIDPARLYHDYHTEVLKLIQDYTERQRIRSGFHTLTFGYDKSTSILCHFSDTIQYLISQAAHAEMYALGNNRDFFSFKSSISKLYSTDRISSYISSYLHSSSKQGCEFMLNLIEAWIDMLLSFTSEFGDLVNAIIESLYLIRYGLLCYFISDITIYQTYPQTQSSLQSSHNIKSFAFLQHFLPKSSLFTPSLINILQDLHSKELSAQASTGLQLKIKKLHEPETVHTIGEKNKKDNAKELEETEIKQVNELFPQYEKDEAWSILEESNIDTLEECYRLWEYALGAKEEYGKELLLSIIGEGSSNIIRTKQTEIHLRHYKDLLEKGVKKEHYDFYKDSNPNELRILYKLIGNLMNRIDGLLKEWPDHSILLESQHICLKVLQRPLFRTPLMQMLSGLDMLLEKCQEWQDYAASSVSLKAELEPIYKIVIKWRKLEIDNWKTLYARSDLDDKKEEIKLWSSLMRVLYVQQATGNTLFEALDEYIRTAKINNFSRRLDLIDKLRFHVSPDQELLLSYIFSFYSQYMEEFTSIMSQEINSYNSKLDEIVKVTQYSLSNFHALKNSIQRSYKQLNLVVRRYKEFMNISFQDKVLKPIRQSFTANILEVPIQTQQETSQIPALSNIECENISHTIFERIETIKASKDDTSLKYAALNDLMKTLKECGFSYFYRSEEMAPYYSQPLLPDIPEEMKEYVNRGERYYYKVIDRITSLQYSIAAHEDLQYEDKQRCLGLAISMMLKLMEVRRMVIKQIRRGKERYRLTENQMEWIKKVQEVANEVYLYQAQQELCGFEKRSVNRLDVTGYLEDKLKAEEVLNSMRMIDRYRDKVEELRTIMPEFDIEMEEEEHTQDWGYLEQLSLSEYISYILNTPDLSFNLNPSLSFFYKSLGKLTYIISNVFLSLFNNGFCRPVEEKEAEAGDKIEDGTGLGEGTGEKDITDQLEDEEQFNSKPNEQPQEDQSEQKDEDQAMDVKQDVEGEDESASGSEGEGDISKAEGNERALPEEMDVDNQGEGEVGNAAQPEEVEESQFRPGTPDASDIEDFEMPEEGVSDEEDKDMKVDRMDDKGTSEEEGEDANSEAEPESEEIEEEKINNEKETQEEEGEEDKEEKERYKDRDMIQYDHETYGTEEGAANTTKINNESQNDTQGGDSEKGAMSDVISDMKQDWSSQGPVKQSDVGPEQGAEGDAMENVEVVHAPDAYQPENPINTSLYSFNAEAEKLAIAPSNTGKEENAKPPVDVKRDAKYNPEKKEQKISEFIDNPDKPADQGFVPPSLIMNNPEEILMSYRDKVIQGIERDYEIREISSFENELNEIRKNIPAEVYKTGVERWSLYERMTREQSQELCEQLRIILEPTRARGLKGDYKTGKRINIKRVIQYLASNFRKDKIWLRRTRATHREYSVLLAIDDSFSMQQLGVGDFAMQGLALVSQALHKLEVGDLSVAAIRNGLNLVHELGRPFTQDSAEFVFSQFSFEHGRDVPSRSGFEQFIEESREYLKPAQRPLVIIISDGRLDKAKVRKALRSCSNITYLFIILDNPKTSIVDMKTTQFNDGKVEIYPYLQDFPFEYYVVIQSPKLLPKTLSDLLRQWFSLQSN